MAGCSRLAERGQRLSPSGMTTVLRIFGRRVEGRTRQCLRVTFFGPGSLVKFRFSQRAGDIEM